ncbi:MAG: GNAT family N-acetyltransferase [Opitutaceae bacterium]|nr:GNAT family N-acetyltransferase [Opitutaceae bacterium]
MSPPLAWIPLTPADLAAVRALADTAHPDLPEHESVFAEKLRLFPPGCRKLDDAGRLLGYGIAHPWLTDDPPPLDTILGALPSAANCLHLHDAVVAPEARGHGLAARYVAEMQLVARAHGLHVLTLVSVYGTHPLWARCGFRIRTPPLPPGILAPYGPTACAMICPV